MYTKTLVVPVLLIAAALFGPAVSIGTAQAGRTMTVTVQGLRSDDGVVLGALYDRSAMWLDHDHPADSCRGSISHGVSRCTFHGAPSSAVAFAGVHDANLNGELDRDAIGIPQEGYAFSNDVRPSLGPPSFESAMLPPLTRTTVVHAQYGL